MALIQINVQMIFSFLNICDSCALSGAGSRSIPPGKVELRSTMTAGAVPWNLRMAALPRHVWNTLLHRGLRNGVRPEFAAEDKNAKFALWSGNAKRLGLELFLRCNWRTFWWLAYQRRCLAPLLRGIVSER
jgi:hypothetical protein